MKTNTKQLIDTELEISQTLIIHLLTEMMEATYDKTGMHNKRVTEISTLLTHYSPDLTEEDEKIIRFSAPLHDIGKLTVPSEILHKKGKYSVDDFEIMKQHTTNAYQILCNSDNELIKQSAIIAHEHHENWDGTGYPQGLKGEEIHIYGRIVALADVLDALSHARCYKEPWFIEDVINFIFDHKGTKFDPDLVDIFEEHIEEFKAIVKAT